MGTGSLRTPTPDPKPVAIAPTSFHLQPFSLPSFTCISWVPPPHPAGPGSRGASSPAPPTGKPGQYSSSLLERKLGSNSSQTWEMPRSSVSTHGFTKRILRAFLPHIFLELLLCASVPDTFQELGIVWRGPCLPEANSLVSKTDIKQITTELKIQFQMML